MLLHLKSCPCCGDCAEVWTSDDNGAYVQCTCCGLRTEEYPINEVVDGKDGYEWAVMTWNRRS